jgi:hypothetical protein
VDCPAAPPYYFRRWTAVNAGGNTLEEPMRNLVPGGYVFTHLVFWTVIGLVIVGTNAVAIMLSVGLVLMMFEAIKSR